MTAAAPLELPPSMGSSARLNGKLRENGHANALSLTCEERKAAFRALAIDDIMRLPVWTLNFSDIAIFLDDRHLMKGRLWSEPSDPPTREKANPPRPPRRTS